MATLRGSSGLFNIGNAPPKLIWTVVRGDTAAFKVFATDDKRAPLNIPDYAIDMTIKRPTSPADLGIITDNATTILDLHPEQDADDGPGEFTVFLAAAESFILSTGDIFDIQLYTPQNQIVWTVAQGSLVILEDVTD